MKKLSLTYAELPNGAGDADLLLPDDIQNDKYPVLVLHGGGWASMDKKDLIGVAEFFAENGYPVLNANYRLSRNAV